MKEARWVVCVTEARLENVGRARWDTTRSDNYLSSSMACTWRFVSRTARADFVVILDFDFQIYEDMSWSVTIFHQQTLKSLLLIRHEAKDIKRHAKKLYKMYDKTPRNSHSHTFVFSHGPYIYKYKASSLISRTSEPPHRLPSKISNLQVHVRLPHPLQEPTNSPSLHHCFSLLLYPIPARFVLEPLWSTATSFFPPLSLHPSVVIALVLS